MNSMMLPDRFNCAGASCEAQPRERSCSAVPNHCMLACQILIFMHCHCHQIMCAFPCQSKSCVQAKSAKLQKLAPPFACWMSCSILFRLGCNLKPAKHVSQQAIVDATMRTHTCILQMQNQTKHASKGATFSLLLPP